MEFIKVKLSSLLFSLNPKPTEMNKNDNNKTQKSLYNVKDKNGNIISIFPSTDNEGPISFSKYWENKNPPNSDHITDYGKGVLDVFDLKEAIYLEYVRNYKSQSEWRANQDALMKDFQTLLKEYDQLHEAYNELRLKYEPPKELNKV